MIFAILNRILCSIYWLFNGTFSIELLLHRFVDLEATHFKHLRHVLSIAFTAHRAVTYFLIIKSSNSGTSRLGF
jgi:hypothetical protein